MKAKNLDDGVYFVKSLKTDSAFKTTHKSNVFMKKKGNQIVYFGSDYFEDAKDIKGIFYEIEEDRIKDLFIRHG